MGSARPVEPEETRMAKKSTQIAACEVAATNATPVVQTLVVAPVKDRKPSFPLTAKITVVSTACPKRPGTKAAAKWPLYDGVKTVADVVAAFKKAGHAGRRAMSALRWDAARGYVKIEG